MNPFYAMILFLDAINLPTIYVFQCVFHLSYLPFPVLAAAPDILEFLLVTSINTAYLHFRKFRDSQIFSFFMLIIALPYVFYLLNSLLWHPYHFLISLYITYRLKTFIFQSIFYYVLLKSNRLLSFIGYLAILSI